MQSLHLKESSPPIFIIPHIDKVHMDILHIISILYGNFKLNFTNLREYGVNYFLL